MKIKLIEKQVTEWIKQIEIEREGEEYRLNLRWDIHSGYEIIDFWKGFELIPAPNWANVPEFEYDLDSMTEEASNDVSILM
jgi:hypothetical protein